MWLMTQIGFFSIVDKTAQQSEGLLTIRARCASDLLALIALYLPESSPIEISEHTDYRYRIRAPRELTAAAIAQLVLGIDYANFKQRISERQGGMRTKICHEIWHSHFMLQAAGAEAEWLDSTWWRFPTGGPMPAPDKDVCVLKVGNEGGSMTLMGRFTKDMWWLWVESEDQTTVMLEEDEVPTSRKSKWMSLSEGLEMLTADERWFMSHPLEIHPWFARRILLAKEHQND